MRYAKIMIFVATISFAPNAMAQDGTSYQLLAKGRYALAIDRLEHQRKINADAPEATLNLATAYARSGRSADARAMYLEVLAEPAVDLDMMNGPGVNSHQVARRGLAAIGQTIATR